MSTFQMQAVNDMFVPPLREPVMSAVSRGSHAYAPAFQDFSRTKLKK